MLQRLINRMIDNERFMTEDELGSAINELMTTENHAHIIAFVTLLTSRGVNQDEMRTILNVMQSHMKTVDLGFPAMDIIGTGGDGMQTVNISTGASLLAASCGVKIAKLGNRSVSSRCGSADVLEQFGININLSPQQLKDCVARNNFGFCYAPLYHQAFANINKARKALGVQTIFNLFGPLLNPARTEYLMIGLAYEENLDLIANILLRSKVKRCMVFHGQGTDEITTAGETKVREVNVANGRIDHKIEYIITPKDYGFKTCSMDDLRGGDPDLNAQILKETLQGKEGPVADTLILNAGVANYLYNITKSIKEGIELAREKHKKGDAFKLLAQVAKLTNVKAGEAASA